MSLLYKDGVLASMVVSSGTRRRRPKIVLTTPEARPSSSVRSMNARTLGKPAKYEEGKIDLALFDLEADPGEKADVMAQHPDVVARLEAIAARFREDLGDGDRPGKGVRPAGTLR